MAPPSDWASDWPLLSEARDRIDTIIATGAIAAAIIDGPVLTLRDDEPVETRLTIAAFRDIIGCGEVPVIAVRDDCGRLTPEPVEVLLTVASNALFYTPINEIDAYFDSRRDRSMFGPRSYLIDMALYPPAERSELQICFSGVRVNWPTLVNKLKAAGFLAGAPPDSAAAQVEPGLPQRAEAINCWLAERDETARAAGANDSNPQKADATKTAIGVPQRGRPPNESRRVERALRAAIKAGKYTPDTLRDCKPISLGEEFHTSRATMQRVLESVLLKKAQK
jgi:hypothetical protein